MIDCTSLSWGTIAGISVAVFYCLLSVFTCYLYPPCLKIKNTGGHVASSRGYGGGSGGSGGDIIIVPTMADLEF